MPVVTWALGKGFATYKVGDFAAATANKGQAFLNPPGTAARPLVGCFFACYGR